MPAFHRLRQFTRWVTLCFVLAVGASVASPLIAPQAMSLVCSGLGEMKLIVQTGDSTAELGSHGLDCPRCANLAAPPPGLPVLTGASQSVPHWTVWIPRLVAAALPRDPWQARAPPRRA